MLSNLKGSRLITTKDFVDQLQVKTFQEGISRRPYERVYGTTEITEVCTMVRDNSSSTRPPRDMFSSSREEVFRSKRTLVDYIPELSSFYSQGTPDSVRRRKPLLGSKSFRRKCNFVSKRIVETEQPDTQEHLTE